MSALAWLEVWNDQIYAKSLLIHTCLIPTGHHPRFTVFEQVCASEHSTNQPTP